jgi:hypothetical protein
MEDVMNSRRKLAMLAVLALFLGLACQIADVLADKPTPPPVQSTAVKSPVVAPPVAPTNALANPTVAPPTAAAIASPTSPVVVPTSTTALSQQSVCPDPNAAITSLAMDGTVAGLIEISGTAARPDMQYWKVEYRTDIGTSYTALNNSDKAVTDGILARWSTKTVPNGIYFVRLVIVLKDGNFGTPCEIRVTISN